MKGLRKAVGNYIKLRRGLGYKLEIAEVRLGQFIDFLQIKKTSQITTKLALEFATQSARCSTFDPMTLIGANAFSRFATRSSASRGWFRCPRPRSRR